MWKRFILQKILDKRPVINLTYIIDHTLSVGEIAFYKIFLALGAKRILAADLFDDKLTLARQMGADETINVASCDLGKTVMEKTHGNGVERICEASGKNKAKLGLDGHE